MMYTASILLDVNLEHGEILSDLRSAYSSACNKLVPIVQEKRIWNRVALHQLVYSMLRSETPLSSQFACNAIFTVCKAYKSQKELGRIKKDKPVPLVQFDRASVHYDKRTYTLKEGDMLSLTTLQGRILVPMVLGKHQRRLMESGIPKEAELIFRKGKWYFNLVIECSDVALSTSSTCMGLDVGENNLAATSTGRIFGGKELRHERDMHLNLRKRLQSNGSISAKQKLRQVSGKEARRMKHINHVTSKAIVEEAIKAGSGIIRMEDLTHIRERIRAGLRMRTRLHRWTFRQLQSYVEYKARSRGIAVEYVNPAYSSQTCSCCDEIGKRNKHLFVCEKCGLRAHADVNASRNLAWIDRTAVLSRAAVSTPNVGAAKLLHRSLL